MTAELRRKTSYDTVSSVIESSPERKGKKFDRSEYILRFKINLEKNLDKSFNPNIYIFRESTRFQGKSKGEFGTREVQIKILESREKDSRTLH